MQNNWGEELNKDRTETIPEEKQTASVWIVNIFFMFVVLFVPFLIAEAIGTVFGWIVPPDSLTHTKDMSRNFYVVYPLYGLITAGLMILLRYFAAKWFGFRQGFRKKDTTRESRNFLHFLAGYAVFEVIAVYFFWNVLPSWFLGGSVAAVLRIFNPYDVFDTVLEGRVEILYLTVYFWWLMVIFEIGFAFASYAIVKKGRHKGEIAGIAERNKQLEELKEEHLQIIEKKEIPKNATYVRRQTNVTEEKPDKHTDDL